MSEIRSITIGLILMIKKYTCIPINLYVEQTEEDYHNGITLLPVLGIAIGMIMFFISIFGYIYNKFFISILIVAFYCVITKGNMLKDLSMAVNKVICNGEDNYNNVSETVSIIIVLMLYFVLFGLVPNSAILLTPIVGFSTLLITGSTIKCDYNKSIINYCKNKERIVAFSIVFAAAVIINYKLVISTSFTFIIIGFILNYAKENIKKVLFKYDGCIIEIAQITFLILTYILKL